MSGNAHLSSVRKDAYGNAVARSLCRGCVLVRATAVFQSLIITMAPVLYNSFIWSGLHTIKLLICEQDIQTSTISFTVDPDALEKERYLKFVLDAKTQKKSNTSGYRQVNILYVGRLIDLDASDSVTLQDESSGIVKKHDHQMFVSR